MTIADTRISLGNVLTILSLAAGGGVFAMQMSGKIERLEAQVSALERTIRAEMGARTTVQAAQITQLERRVVVLEQRFGRAGAQPAQTP